MKELWVIKNTAGEVWAGYRFTRDLSDIELYSSKAAAKHDMELFEMDPAECAPCEVRLDFVDRVNDKTIRKENV